METKNNTKHDKHDYNTIKTQCNKYNKRHKTYNTKINKDESIRVFPLSNWTELEIWQYIYKEKISIVPLYLSSSRPVIERNEMLIMVDDDRIKLLPKETIKFKNIRVYCANITY